MAAVSIRRLSLNTLTVGLGRWIAQLLNVLILPLILAQVSPDDFGLFSLLQIAALILGVIMSFGLNTAFIAQFNLEENRSNLLGRILAQQTLFGMILLIAFLVFTRPLLDLLDIHHSPVLLYFLLVGEYFANLVLITNRWQILANRHWQWSIVALCRSVMQLLLLLIFVLWFHYGLLGLVIADFGSKVFSFVMTFYLTNGEWKFEFKSKDVKSVFTLGLPAMPDTIFFWLILFLPLYILKQSGLLAFAGAFSLIWRLMSPVELLGNSLASAAASKMVDKETIISELDRWYRISILLVVLASTTIMFFVPDLFAAFFDPTYYQIVPFAPVISAGVMFLAFYYFEWLGVSGSGKTYGLSLASGAGVAIMLAGIIAAGDMPSGFTVILLFALSFFSMWAVARLVNAGRKLGQWYFLMFTALPAVLLGLLVANSQPSSYLLIVKVVVLLVLALVVLLVELNSYLKNANTSDSGWSFLTIPNYAEIATRIGSTTMVLDIGCSEGFFLGDLPYADLKVGVDTDFDRLRIGRSSRPSIDFVLADAANLPFRSECFQTVVCIGILPYLEQPVDMLKEARRVLVTSGRVEVSAANATWTNRYLNLYNLKYQFRFYSLDELVEFLKLAGLNIREFYSRGPIIAPLANNLFIVANYIDRLYGNKHSVIGPCARLTRRLTNPIIQWEYDRFSGSGYQNFVSGFRND